MIVVLGGNEFVDCENILAASGEPLLSIRSTPLSITFRTPRAWPQSPAVTIVANEVTSPQDGAHVVRDATSVSVVFRGFPMLVAISEGQDRVLLRLDLRPLGINVFDDAEGLHIGGNSYRGNRISNAATGISLG